MTDHTEPGERHRVSVGTETLPGATVLTVTGELDLLAADSVRSALDELLVVGVPALVVDLTDLMFIDSIGLGILVRTHKKARVFRTRFALVCPEGTAAHRLLSLTGVMTALRVHGTRGEALLDLAA